MSQKLRAAWGKTAPSEGFRGVYINLDRSLARRRNMERQLARLGLAEAYLRLPAVDGQKLKPVGKLNAGIVGCFRSHLAALELARGARASVHIVEDDVIFSKDTAPFIRHALAEGTFVDYDLVFLDMWIDPVVELVERFIAAAGALSSAPPLDYSRFSLVDLKGIRIGAAASYVLSPSKLEKVIGLLTDELARGPTVPVDHFYHLMTERGALRTAVVVPFLTSIDLAEGAVSQTQTLPAHDHRLFLLLRSAFYVERDMPGVVIPGMDAYRGEGRRGLSDIRNRLAATAGIPPL